MAEPNGYIQGTNGVPLELIDKTARAELPKKLTQPATAQVGDYLRIKAIGADGTMEVEAVPAPTGGGSGSGGNVALTTVQSNALNALIAVMAFSKEDVSAELADFRAAFELKSSGGDTADKILTSISAVHTGGSVPVGTAVSALTGITVTAHYSDGSTATVTGYTLSGTIAEGENTITVTYQGKTATFTVIGITDTGGEEDGGEETGVSNESTWTSGVAYTFEPIMNEYPDKANGVITPYDPWVRTPYLYCLGASTLRVTATATTSALQGGVNDNAFYDADKNFVSAFSYTGLANAEPGTYVDVVIPENAAYFILSGTNGRFPGTGGTTENGCITLTPLGEVVA